MAATLIPYLFTLGAAVAACTIAGTCRAYLPAIRAVWRDAIEG
jgi:hypothetical protein